MRYTFTAVVRTVSPADSFIAFSSGYTLKILVRLAVDMSDLGWVYIHSKTVDPEIIDLQQQLK